jgi:hypothetical protein
MALQFNPGNVDRSGEILGAASANAANTRLAGTQMMAQGIGQATDSVVSGAMGGLQKYMEQGQVAQMAAGKLDMAQALGGQYGLDMSFMDQMMEGNKDPYKMNAMADMAMMHIEQQMKNSYQDRAHELAMRRMEAQSGFTQSNQANAAALRPVTPPGPTRTQWGGFNVAPGIDMSR